ncbi:MAG: RpsU-divergently transcribed [Novosphingobium sp. 28-62-57]|uniref:COQ9 family protein n=1 Tax=unclassified Novosphingobium TaxID=2644732 RepID=UPI000BD73BC8|nr:MULTISPECIES: COQ9 family protein [unclassified Novosphingobium]OYW48678.1 MAG: RpsU-divergently transcribed [Novosphingobium sp. 12-62-10]OYZ10230.1 MAG: RpsU-divergently transcribed [Novosphingobium sp. 28-62-57]OZA34857.1 MAG: RpsU-divergently transcribed [Novosphingobium sp. 17-62-9]HQS70442.1 COQ9 family protein [Novosphingobium sp.]
MTEDTSLEALRLRLAPAIAEAAAFDGWKPAAVAAAAEMEGVDPALAAFAFEDGPQSGAMQMITAWVARIDADMAQALPPEHLATLPIRERIRTLVQFRLDALTGKEEALRRALAIMAMPQNVAASARMGWSSADAMWRLAGDTATDYNHYTKRITLGSIYAATLAYFAQDTSDGHDDTRAFLDRRIENVMQFEKAKAKVMKPRADEGFSLMRMLGRLRYPAV